MSEEVINEVTSEAVEGSPSEAPQFTAEEQAAIERYRESQKTEAEKAEGMPEGYNEDGTPVEDLIDGKFKSQEDLLAAYKELEKKFHEEPKAEEPKEEAPVENTVEDSEGNEFSITKYEEEVAANGSLSEDSYKELAAKGFSKDQVDAYIRGQQYYGESLRASIYDSVGGQENYVELMNWASENMPQDVIKEYNDAVDSLNQDKMLRALEYMALKKGSAPTDTKARRIEGESGGTGLQPFADKNEWQRAQTNRLYGRDVKYTQMVDQRYLAARKKGLI